MWRYSRIDQLDLERFHPVGPTPGDGPDATLMERARSLIDGIGPRAGLVVTYNGVLASLDEAGSDASFSLAPLPDHDDAERLFGAVASDPSDFVLLNEAFAPDPLVIDVSPKTVVPAPIVVLHLVDSSTQMAGAVFPRTVIRAGAEAEASVVEIVLDVSENAVGARLREPTGAPGSPGPDGALLVVPVTEVEVGDDASLAYVSIQALGSTTWQLAHQVSRIGAEASLRSFAVALGGSFARLRTDSALVGHGGSSELRAVYLGRDDQMLDFRTLQDHAAPRTRSDLLFKGAVADRAHSVYSGLIRVHRGAVRSDAMQTNHNLVLDEGAHADSVPNLDIEENDVRCSHGSTVGPVDEDQRYYLESRGVDPQTAEQLIVAGFFADIAQQLPIDGVRPLVQRALAHRLDMAVAGPLDVAGTPGAGAAHG